MLYREVPFLRFTTAIICGILFAGLAGPYPMWLILQLISILTLLIILKYSDDRLLFSPFGVAVFIFLLLFGCNEYNLRKESLLVISPGNRQLTLQVTDYPSVRTRTIRVPAKLISVDGSRVKGGLNNLMLYIYKDRYVDSIQPGDVISTHCEPGRINDLDTTDNFNYVSYMERKGYRYLAFTNSYKLIPVSRRNIRSNALIIRNRLLSVYKSNGVTGDNLALVSALTLGYRELLSPDVEDWFARSGIMHVLAVSGLHVGIISLFVMGLLSFISRKYRIVKIVIVITAIWSFAFVTGLNPPVVRAALMFSILHTGQLINRPVNSLNSVLASAFIMLTVNPDLLFEAGFQLSYSAVIFIILFYNDLRNLVMVKGKILKWAWNLTVVSILAQLGTLPFVLYYFQRVPLVSLLANLIAIPLAFLILATGFMLICTSMIHFITPPIVSFLNFLLSTLLESANTISSIPFSSFTIRSISTVSLILLIFTIPLITGFVLKKNSVHPHLVLSVIILSVLTF